MVNRNLSGEGPWEFEAPALSPGETYRLDFRNMTHRGRARYFRPKLPLEDAQVTNTDDANPVRVEINHEFGGQVQANSERPFPDSGVEYLSVANIGGSEIAAEDVVIEVSSTGWTADKEARENKQRRSQAGLGERVVRDIVPGLSL